MSKLLHVVSGVKRNSDESDLSKIHTCINARNVIGWWQNQAEKGTTEAPAAIKLADAIGMLMTRVPRRFVYRRQAARSACVPEGRREVHAIAPDLPRATLQ